MDDHPLIHQIAVIIRRTIQEEFKKHRPFQKNLSDVWANEQEVLELCGKSRVTLYRAIESGKINPKDIRQNPIGKGYLFRRSAIVKD